VFSGRALRRCVPTAVIVGSILSAINQGGVIADGQATFLTWIRVGSNFLIPFVVANAGYCSAVLARRGAAVDGTRGDAGKR
ncbi:MAG TPA: nitrate/nitrite transporter NrtS, partial [Actinomycetota bacterium]|nr:nitrate/nitrite transporter NrtS [Actinomycetota bacterium]